MSQQPVNTSTAEVSRTGSSKKKKSLSSTTTTMSDTPSIAARGRTYSSSSSSSINHVASPTTSMPSSRPASIAEAPIYGRKIFCGNVSFKTNERALYHYFSQYGEITEVMHLMIFIIIITFMHYRFVDVNIA